MTRVDLFKSLYEFPVERCRDNRVIGLCAAMHKNLEYGDDFNKEFANYVPANGDRALAVVNYTAIHPKLDTIELEDAVRLLS
jgi:hypothetical protein